MSRVIYGAAPGAAINDPAGIELSYIRTKNITDEPQYSDDGTEYLYTRRLLSIQAIVNSTLLPSLAGESATQTMARIRHILETPRRQLYFLVGNNEILFQCPAPGAQNDAKWGPFPRPLVISQIGGSQTFVVDYQIEMFVIECPAGQFPQYISHRWRESVSIDQRAFTTKTRTGKIITRADFYTNPDALRGVTVPPIDNGFVRQQAEYVLQDDGLALMYTFRDREVYVQPPVPAFEAEGEYIESVEDGAMRHGECHVRLAGAKTDTAGGKGALLAAAITVVLNKLELEGVYKTGQPVGLQAGSFRESLYDNVIEVRYRTRIAAIRSRTGGAAVDLRRFGWAPVGSDLGRGTPPDPGTRGTAGLAMIASVLHDPCLQQAVLTSGGTQASLKTGASGIPNPIIWQTTVLPDPNPADHSLHTVDDLTGIYQEYKIKTTYDEDPHVHQMATCSMGAPAAFVQLAATTAKRIDLWRSERMGNWPKAPPPTQDDLNMNLLKTQITIREAKLDADGVTMRYILGGENIYGYVDYTKAQLTAGVPPYVDPSIRQLTAVLPRTTFQRYITDAGPSSGTNYLHGESSTGTTYQTLPQEGPGGTGILQSIPAGPGTTTTLTTGGGP